PRPAPRAVRPVLDEEIRDRVGVLRTPMIGATAWREHRKSSPFKDQQALVR
ncbi:MAG: hypothetical protein ACI8TQ_002054, partial [Planctomycetota bacterium]